MIFTDKPFYLVKFYENKSSIKSLDMIGLKWIICVGAQEVLCNS